MTVHQKYHRYLNLPFEVDKPLIFKKDLDKIQHIELKEKFVPVKVREWLKSLGLKSMHTEAFFTAPNDKIFIHCDSPKFDDHVKINFTWGDENSYTRWWSVKDEKFLKNGGTEYGADILVADEHHCNMTYQQVINKPSLLNVGRLHSTYNPTDEGRWTLCIIPSFIDKEEFIHWDIAIELLKEVIV